MKKRTILALLVVAFIVALIWAMSNWHEPSKFTSGELIRSLPAAIAFGFIAGLILNVMPCVLPVVGLKVYSLVNQSGEDRHRVRLLGLSFAAGIVFVFLVLAGLAAFAGLGWGQQFQSDGFLVAMIALLVVFALGMFEVYTIQIPGFVSRIEGAAHREGVTGSFAHGMLATVLATPCSGPFLGATLTYATLQPPPVTFAIFASIGLGMAAPYVAFAWNPGWLTILPRPGAWMNALKEGMAFLMLGAAVWLLWQRRSDGDLVVWTVAFCLFVGLAAWLYGRLSEPSASTAKRIAAPAVAVLVVVFGAYFCFDLMYTPSVAAPISEKGTATTSRATWQPFQRSKLDAHLALGNTVIVNWKADWCLTCKVVEQVVLKTDEVQSAIENSNVVTLQADLTKDNPEAYALMDELGHAAHSIPFLVVFPAGNPEDPQILRDLFKKDDLLSILNKL